MRSELLDSFLERAVAFDCETHKIQPGLLAPPLVCASVARWNPATGRSEGRLLDVEEALAVFLELLEDERCIIVGANIAYDIGVMAHEHAIRGRDVMPLVIRAYEAGRVYDIQIAEALHAVALGCLGCDPRTFAPLQDPLTKKRGRYSLSIVLWLVLGRADAKANDRFRQSYALLEGVPVAEWPPEARTYPVDDACNTLDAALAQVGAIPRVARHTFDGDRCTSCGWVVDFGSDPECPPRRERSQNLHDLAAQCYAALAMHFGAMWGFVVDPEAIARRKAELVANREKTTGRFVERGFLRWKKTKGVTRASRHTAVVKRAVALAYGATSPCPTCAGTGKVTSAKSGKPVGCRACDSTGLELDGHPVPRTDGSKCRTCRGLREFADKKSGALVGCSQCDGQPDVIPGCQTSRDALSESGDEDLVEFAVSCEEGKLLDTYIPYLERGIVEVDDVDEDEGDDE